MCAHAGKIFSSRCLQVQVGQLYYDPIHDVQHDGGIERTTMTDTGILQLSARVGVTNHSPNKKRNLNGGLLEWVVDDQVVAGLEVGPIEGVPRFSINSPEQSLWRQVPIPSGFV